MEDFNDLVHSIYQAAIKPAEWAVFVEKLSDLLGGTVISLHAHDAAAKAGLGIYISKLDPEYLSSYNQYYASKSIWAEALGGSPIGKLIQSEELIGPDEFHKTEYYNDYLKPQDFCAASAIIFHRSQGKFLMLAGTIRHQELDRVRRPLHKMLTLLTPHIAHACEMARGLPACDSYEDYRGMMERSDKAFFLIDQYGRITRANRAAALLLSEASLLVAHPGGALEFRDPQANTALQAALGAIKSSDFTRLRGDFAVRQTVGASLRAIVAPFERAATQSIFDLAFEDLSIASLVVQTQPPRPALFGPMSRAYGLTPAEFALAQAIADGLSPRDYAQTRGVSTHTVRTQLKTVFAKTETSRQSQLAALLSRTQNWAFFLGHTPRGV